MPAEQTCDSISYSRDSGLPGSTFESCDTELDTLEYNLLITSMFRSNYPVKLFFFADSQIVQKFLLPCESFVSAHPPTPRKVYPRFVVYTTKSIGKFSFEPEISRFNDTSDVKSVRKCLE